MRICWLILFVIPFIACSHKVEHGCEATGKITPYCGIQSPEDIVALPDGQGLIVSEFGMMGRTEGRLSWFEPNTRQYKVLFPIDQKNEATLDTRDNWGGSDCQIPAKVSPHGIHLSNRDGVWQLLVVNHGEKEQVLFFEVRLTPEIELHWRGCVTFPDYAQLNDVAALPDGGFVVSHMYGQNHPIWNQFKAMLGRNTGFVWRWSPDRELSRVEGSVGSMPNGLAVGADGDSLFVNMYTGSEVRRVSLSQGTILDRVDVKHPDNSDWSSDGRLIVASHHTSMMEMMHCFDVTQGSCGGAFEIVAIAPDTLEKEVIFKHDGGGPFGPATIAVKSGDSWYLGSFSGDRLGGVRGGSDGSVEAVGSGR